MLKELVKSRVFPVATVLAGSIFLASCSSGVSRFDMPMFGLSGSEDKAASTASLSDSSRLGQGMDSSSGYADGSTLAEFENDRNASGLASGSNNYNSRSSYLPPQKAAPEVRSARYNAVERSPLSSFGQHKNTSGQVGNNSGAQRYNSQPMKPIRQARRSFLPAEPSQYDYNSNANARTRPAGQSSAATQRGAIQPTGNQQITVGTGDTLYSISRRYKVSVVKLMELNSLSDSKLNIGQRLIVPGKGPVKAVQRASIAKRPQLVRATSSGTYTVRPGENFRSIAKKLKISPSKLADINGITDPGSIRAGEVLILPTRGKTVRARSVQRRQNLNVRSVKTKSIKLGSAKSKTTQVSKKQISVAAKKIGKKASGATVFRWPVRGRIIEKFGPRGDGTHNDGINLAVPNGTRVKAAEAGIVAYAGSELKGYGNLVLIRHDNNWVSAYAHNDKLMVKRGDKIKRGQVVARAGTSGSVEQPQVHFELRKGSKPVNPTKYMAGT